MVRTEHPKVPPPRGRLEATYDYRDEHGNLLYQVLRYLPKRFRTQRPTKSGGWSTNVKRVRRVPYRLPELLAATSSEPVFIVEGEKDVDRLRSLGFVATCNSGGGGRGKWPRSHSRLLCARDVIIIPDNDVTGRQHADDVALRLYRHARSIRMVQLPGLSNKGDVSDWLDQGKTAVELQQLVSNAPLWKRGKQRSEFSDEYHDLRERSMHLGDILMSELSAQEKLLLIILTSKAQTPPLTLNILGQYMSLGQRRLNQIIGMLRKSEHIRTWRYGRRANYQANMSRVHTNVF